MSKARWVLTLRGPDMRHATCMLAGLNIEIATFQARSVETHLAYDTSSHVQQAKVRWLIFPFSDPVEFHIFTLKGC